jgi:hypothetical protein
VTIDPAGGEESPIPELARDVAQLVTSTMSGRPRYSGDHPPAVLSEPAYGLSADRGAKNGP